jgi:hypothetical protein
MIVLSPSRHSRRVPQLHHERFPPHPFYFTTDQSFHHRRHTAWDTVSVVKQTTLTPLYRFIWNCSVCKQEDDCCGTERERGMKFEHVMCSGCNTYEPTNCMKKILFWKYEKVLSSQKSSPLFMKLQISVFTSSLQNAPIISHTNPVHSSHFLSWNPLQNQHSLLCIIYYIIN